MIATSGDGSGGSSPRSDVLLALACLLVIIGVSLAVIALLAGAMRWHEPTCDWRTTIDGEPVCLDGDGRPLITR